MLKFWTLAIAAILFLTGCLTTDTLPPISKRPPPRLRVMTWNIHHGAGMDGKLDLERIANVIKAHKPDVVALQEVDVNVPRSGNVDQLKKLAELTGMTGYFGKAIDLDGGAYGNAILTRYSLANNNVLPRAISLHSPGSTENRSVMEADLYVRAGFSIKVLASHFDVKPEISAMNAKTIGHAFQFINPPAGILMGDFNATPDSETLAELGRKWKRIASIVDDGTAPADKPRMVIDYIMVQPKTEWELVSYKVIDEPVASDHRPVLAVLDYIQKGRQFSGHAPMPSK